MTPYTPELPTPAIIVTEYAIIAAIRTPNGIQWHKFTPEGEPDPIFKPIPTNQEGQYDGLH